MPQDGIRDNGAFELAKPPICTLRPNGSRVSNTGTLTLTAKCDQPAQLTLTGTFTVKPRRKKGSKKKPRTKTFDIAPVKGSAQPNKPLNMFVKVPKKVLRALKHRAKVSAAFTLTGKTA